jgi:hypothetical protein
MFKIFGSKFLLIYVVVVAKEGLIVYNCFMSIESPQSNFSEIPKYTFNNAKEDLVSLLSAEDFQTPEVDEVMGRLLKSKIGELLIFFVGGNNEFKSLPHEIRGRIEPLVGLIQNSGVERPNNDDFPVYLALSAKVVSEVSKVPNEGK